MNRILRFTRFSLLKAPGFGSHFFPTLTFPPHGLQIIYGPNGVGKTTLMRSLRSLLATTGEEQDLEAEAVFSVDQELWNLSLSEGKLVQTQLSNGQEARIPGRNDEYGQAYWLSLHDLLGKEGSNTVFLDALHKQLQGGIDLAKAYQTSKAITAFSNSRNSLTKQVKDSTAKVEKLQSQIRENVHLAEQLESLHKTVDDRPQKEQLRKLFNQALAYQKIEQAWKQADEHIQSFDQRLKGFSSYTYEEALKREAACQEAQAQLATAQHDLQACKKDLQDIDLPIDGATDPTLILDQIQECKERLRIVQSASDTHLGVQANLETWETEHAFLVGEKPQTTQLEQMVKRLTQLSLQCEPLRCAVDSSARLSELLGVQESFDTKRLELLRQAKDGVLALLHASTQAKTANRTKPVSFLVVGLIVLPFSLFSMLLSWFNHPALAALCLALMLMGMAVVSRRQKNPEYAELQRACDHQKQVLAAILAELDSTMPGDDGFDTLARMLSQLNDRIAEQEKIRELNQQRSNARNRYEQATQAYEGWRKAYQEVSEALNLSSQPALEGSQFFHFSDQLKTWAELLAKSNSAKTVYDDAKQQAESALETLKLLCNIDADTPQLLLSKAKGLVQVLEHVQLLGKREKALAEDVESLKESLSHKEVDRAGFYADLGLEVADIQSVQRLSDQLESYQKYDLELKVLEKQLADQPDEITTLANGVAPAELEQQLADLEQELKRYDEIQIQIGQLQERYDQACNNVELEKAELEKRTASEALEEQRRKEVQLNMANVLFTLVKTKTETEYQPQVVRQADHWLRRITEHRYGFGVGETEFIAQDLVLEKPFALSALSSGARIQLLFAVRMAFLELLEGGSGDHLPLFIDEVMANSDDQRSLAIAQAILEIAKERQVFYCTAQYDEVQKFVSLAKDAVNLIDLEDEKRSYHHLKHPYSPSPSERSVEVPFAEDYGEYASRLRVPKPDVHDQIGSLSTWFLCTDSEELYALLKRGFSQIGQAKEVSDVYRKRYDLLSFAQETARTGRARIVEAVDLHQAPAVLKRGTTYFNDLEAFVAAGNHDGNDILEALEAKTLKGFRDVAKEALRDWLLLERFASEEPRLGINQILDQLHLEFDDFFVDCENQVVVVRYLESVLA
ncbi:MAG: AAA family ATPase [Sphaerochaeta sp.]|uniref:AAA family ATPase n=1 Tax=Sphaerochaeta sp. TaxID=1972642 RepID=UPI003D0AFC1A